MNGSIINITRMKPKKPWDVLKSQEVSKMKKIILSIFLVFGVTAANAEPADKSVELICNLDTGVEIRVSIDLENKFMQMAGIEELKLPIVVNETNVVHENKTDDFVWLYVEIDRFSLEYRKFSQFLIPGWTKGQCTKLSQGF